MKKKIALLLLALIILTSCTYEPPSPGISVSPGPTQGPDDDPNYNLEVEPVEGGIINLGVSAFSSLHPLYTDNEDIKNYMSLVYEGLFSLDELLNIKEGLAIKAISPDGGLTWIIDLRENVSWHDGDPFNAHDCLFTLGLIMEGPSLYSSIAGNVDKLTLISDLSFEIALKEIDLYLPSKLTFPLVKNNSKNLSMVPNGTGIYRYVSWEGKAISLVRNNDYWGKAPYIDEVIINIYDNERQKFEADSDIFILQEESVSRYLNKDSYLPYKYLGRGYVYLMPSLKAGSVMSKNNIRKAVHYVLDKDHIINMALAGMGVQAKWPILPGTSFNQLTESKIDRDLDKASEYLQAEGYIKSADGLWYKSTDSQRKNPLTISCNILSSSQEMRLVGDTIQGQLADFGLILNITYQNESDYSQAVKNLSYDLTIMKINISSMPDFKTIFSSRGPMNLNSYSNSSLEPLLDNIYGDEDISKRIKDIEDILDADLPLIGIYISQEALVVSNKILGRDRKYNFYSLLGDFGEFHLYTKGVIQ